jgi:hypothetical protein
MQGIPFPPIRAGLVSGATTHGMQEVRVIASDLKSGYGIDDS